MADFKLRCSECGATYAESEVELVCPNCAGRQQPNGSVRGVLEVDLDAVLTTWPNGLLNDPAVLADLLPIASPASLAPLQVGGTPLLPVPRLREHLATPALWVKDDTRNPSGSTKDRASLLVVAKAREYGHDTVALASSGNAGTALAAVAAAAGMRAVVFVPATVPEAKLVQALAYGAEVLPVNGPYDAAFELCTTACQQLGWYNRNTALNPFTVEGKKTAGIEIAAALAPEAPDVVVIPVGDGVILSGVAKGFADLVAGGLLPRLPRLIAVQPTGSAAIVNAVRAGNDDVEPVTDAASIADSLVVQVPRGARLCLRRIRESKGTAVAVSDHQIVAAIATLARLTGFFAEPAAAAALAGLEVALQQQLIDREECTVLLVTGNGLKDVPAAAGAVQRPDPIEPRLDALMERLGLA